MVTIEDVEIIPEDIPGWQVASDGNITVAVDVTLTPGLRNEGMARELVNRIQNIRKDSDFNITDKVDVVLTDAPGVKEAVEAFGGYIASQVLADSINVVDSLDEQDAVKLNIDGLELHAKVTRK